MTMTTEAAAPPRQWTSTAGPRQTKAVNEALGKFRWRSKTVRRLTGVIGVSEHAFESTLLFGGVPCDGAAEALHEIGDKYGWQVTRENCRQLEADILEAAAKLEIAVVDERITPEQNAERNAAWAKADQERKEAAAKHAATVANLVAELREKYPWAKGPDDGKLSPQARAAANIKAELSRAFPGIKFSVRSEGFSMGDAVDVGWELGPTTQEVDALLGKYKRGSFDGMTDSYDYDHSAFGDAVDQVLGRSKYVHSSRRYPDGVMELLGKAICQARGKEYQGLDTRNVLGDSDSDWLSTHVHRMLAHASFPPGAVLTGVEDETREDVLLPHRPTFTAPAELPAADKPSEGGAGLKYRIEKHRHTKKGFDMWIVVLVDRVERDQFDRLNALAEGADGWYSRKWGRCPGGFAFKDESAARQWAEAYLG